MDEYKPFLAHLPPGYRLTHEPCAFGLYWHLEYEGERINGGIATCEETVLSAAKWGATWHRYGVPLVTDADW